MATVVFLLPGTTSWTPPEGVTSTKVECLGPGGNGATGNGNIVSKPGGGGGGYDCLNAYAVTPGVPINVQVGAAGSGNATWFNSSSTVIGRAGGNAVTNGAPGAGGAVGVGDVTYAGGNGGGGTTNSTGGGGGGGAAGPSGTGKNGGTGTGTSGGGSGGGGSRETVSPGAGAPGIIVLTYEVGGDPDPVRRPIRTFHWL